MTYWLAIAFLVAGQCADLWIDWLKLRRNHVTTKDLQAWLLKTGLLKAATYLPAGLAVWWLGTAGAVVAGAQGFAFAAWKYWQLRRSRC
jgi:hypothetical protein